MAKSFSQSLLLVLVIILVSIHFSEQLQSSQVQTLLRIQHLLNSPAILSSWNDDTDFCNTEPSPSLTVVCYDESITQLHIIGIKKILPLPKNFSIDSFFTTLVRIPSLKVLTLVSLGLWGPLPEILALSDNQFSGEVPDLSSLTSLQVLDLENNSLGSQFPRLGAEIVTLVLSKNKFSAGIPDEVSFYYQLQKLDISFNRFVAPFPPSILALPSITYLNIAGNRFTGMLFENQSCNSELEFVDLSSNLLTGKLPNCFQSNSKKTIVLYSGNCLTTGDKNQHPFSYCRNEAFAVGILPHRRKPEQASKVGLALSVSGGIIGGIALVGLAFLIFRRVLFEADKGKNTAKANSRELINRVQLKVTVGSNQLVLSNIYDNLIIFPHEGYISQAMKLGALGIPAYRTFSFEELELATDNFDTSTFLDEGSHGQMYRGHLKDGSVVAIRCTKMKRSHGTQSFMHHIELISKLRHRHLVSALGHCFECYLDDSSVSRLFLVFEYVPNGTLRSWLSERRGRRTLTWAQRISAAIGVAKGIQFLHTGIVPEESLGKVGFQISSGGTKEFNNKKLLYLTVFLHRVKHDEKSDVYDFGVILQEIIVGRPLNSMNEVGIAKDQLQRIVTADNAVRRSIVDPAIRNAYSDESLKTMVDICIRCLLNNPEDRPSIEDVLWNLQFAAQVQEAWRGDSQSSDGSPVLHFEPPRRQINLQ
ncbi:leucine-rich repeat protein kinase family protein [Actinidia rufa]|uniref:Leucine-rich repeat protein kinase family protein n=1 Tax=Actinidia rufa TaxID=165716 RepID=A0A7J0FH60_9ERIC|nr:leucine-rich repeat protein kinase family protein [Actinidia rufa]